MYTTLTPHISHSDILKGLVMFIGLLILSCQSPTPSENTEEETTHTPSSISTLIPVLLDTDANNELDDQHAIAYLLLSQDVFEVVGITVNRTDNGGNIEEQFAEADRIAQLCDMEDEVQILKGADKSFREIKEELANEVYDGQEAVEFIIEQANMERDIPLVLLPIGKLTNIALALEQAPEIMSKVRIVWLGSNYPEPGEYNQVNDTSALTYILNLPVPFEMVMVRYGKASGTDAVKITPQEAQEHLAGKGPAIDTPVEGRHGGKFTTFGDYAVNLFENMEGELYGDPPGRALFDMAAVAIVKNSSWADSVYIPAPKLTEGKWEEQPENPRTVVIWENFHKEEILADFFETINQAGE